MKYVGLIVLISLVWSLGQHYIHTLVLRKMGRLLMLISSVNLTQSAYVSIIFIQGLSFLYRHPLEARVETQSGISLWYL